MRVILVNSDLTLIVQAISWNGEASCADAIRLVRFEALREIGGLFSFAGLAKWAKPRST